MIINPNHICFTSSAAINEISKPLFDSSNLNYFSYGRVFNKNSCFVFHTSTPLIENWFKLQAPAPSCYPEGAYLWENLLTDDLKKISNELNFDNGICIVKHYDNYSDIFAFNSPKGASSAMSLYLNEMNALNKFCLYFKDQAAPLITQALADPIVIPDVMVTPIEIQQQQQKLSKAMDALKIKNYYFNEKYSGIKLTKREVECLSLYLKGKTSHEIANLLSLNKKTIDTFLTLIKKKFDCRTRSELFEIIWELGIMQSNGWINVNATDNIIQKLADQI